MSTSPAASVEAAPTGVESSDESIDVLQNLPFIGMHVACLAVVWTGVSTTGLVIGLLALAVRMFGLTAGYHRYFCHRSFKTGRVVQFVLAWLGAAAGQRGPLWWAGHHRRHHRYSDTASDAHPPGVKGFFWAHVGWVMSRANNRTRIEWVPDLAKYPELRWLDRHHYWAPLSLGVAVFALGTGLASAYPRLGTGGWQLVVVLCWSTVLLYHVTFAVNSVGHLFGQRRYQTRDESRNSFWLALMTGGEGWHNNHHRFPASERQGFYRWEIDLTHYLVALLATLGLVWDVRGPSRAVLDEGSRS